MHRIDTPGNVNGLFVPPNPLVGQQAVVVDSDWLNDIQENLMALLVPGGIVPAEGDYSQLLTAIQYIATRINVPAGANGGTHLQKAGLDRWEIMVSADPETGGNTGSLLQFLRYSDAGVFIDVPFEILRNTGTCHFNLSPDAPTPPLGNNSTLLATTAFLANYIASAFTASVGANGYIRIPTSTAGQFLILQWGAYQTAISAEGLISVTFPEAFPSTCEFALPWGINTSGLTNRDLYPQFASATRTGASFYCNNPYNSSALLDGVGYLALGF